jgi:transcription initiation factor TFIIIB Brf1 subunit/transcription initiation factor TFIIB
MTNKSDELKPCPFCGSKDVDKEFSLHNLGYDPGCFQCGAVADKEMWNKRPYEEKLEQKNKILIEALEQCKERRFSDHWVEDIVDEALQKVREME